ncbi:MAG: FAD-binding oxidoreductase [Bdellovibrionota bacterium]
MRRASHEEKVDSIAAEIRRRLVDRKPVHISKGGVSHFVPNPDDPRTRSTPIEISKLNEVLRIDTHRRLCVAEPGVTFSKLVRETLRHGLLPMVVPELKGITVGGAVAGCSIESMSYRYGGFHDSCMEYEIISGRGRVLRCSRRQEPLFFEMIHGSYGTLGVLSEVTFRLVPAKPYVRMEYRKFRTFDAFEAELLERCRQKDFDFIDGIIHQQNLFVVCLGRFVEEAPYTSDYQWLNIYYRSTAELDEDYLSTYDYCFRYDTECHWMTKTVPLLENPVVRLLVGKFVLGSSKMIWWSKALERLFQFKKRPDVVCDVFIPARNAAEFHAWYRREFSHFPLWVIPYRIPKPYGWIAPEHAERMGDKLFLDFAVYGMPNDREEVDLSHLLEEKTFELNGIKTLISRNHYSRDRFWRIYDQQNYSRAKMGLDPHGVFPDLYEKFHPSGGSGLRSSARDEAA